MIPLASTSEACALDPHLDPRSIVTASSDALGGALDGALQALHVPLQPHPYGQHLSDVEQLSLAIHEAGLEPAHLTLALGFDCSAANRKAGKAIFAGKPLHASADGVLGPDPNPYQLAIFMLGKALEAIGVPSDVSVRCFCYSTQPPPPGEWLAPREVCAAKGSAPDSAVEPRGATDARGSAGGGAGVVGAVSGAQSAVPGAQSAGSGATVQQRSQLPPDGNASKWAEPVVCPGMAAALDYYNTLPPYVFRGVRGQGAAPGLAEAVLYGGAIATADAAAGGSRTLLMLLTPAQGIDAAAARAALASVQRVRLSVIALGVGDGPFHEIARIAAACPQNLTAVDFHRAINGKFPDRELALAALRALPEQALHPEWKSSSIAAHQVVD